MSDRRFSYLLVDVFTRERLKGNPLAVVLKADGLSDAEMQAVAKEFNLSETIFVHKPLTERNTALVRIFTPAVELPFAGHPTVGVSVVLSLQHKLSAVRIEEQVGLITALVERVDRRTGEARFALPKLPARTFELTDTLRIAQALGIHEDDVGCGPYRPGVYSAGTEFHLVPVRDATVLRNLKRNPLVWNEAFPHSRNAAYIFTATPNEPATDFAARMFAPGMGLGEDPGTGAAASALIGLLAEHVGHDTGQSDFVLRQGHEMGRPCRITMQVGKQDGRLVHGGIGGHAVIIAEGVLDLSE